MHAERTARGVHRINMLPAARNEVKAGQCLSGMKFVDIRSRWRWAEGKVLAVLRRAQG